MRLALLTLQIDHQPSALRESLDVIETFRDQSSALWPDVGATS